MQPNDILDILLILDTEHERALGAGRGNEHKQHQAELLYCIVFEQLYSASQHKDLQQRFSVQLVHRK